MSAKRARDVQSLYAGVAMAPDLLEILIDPFGPSPELVKWRRDHPIPTDYARRYRYFARYERRFALDDCNWSRFIPSTREW